MALRKPVRLELNRSGSWKLLSVFDADVDTAANTIMRAAENLAKALNDPACGREALVSLRISTDAEHPAALGYWHSDRGGWVDAKTREPLNRWGYLDDFTALRQPPGVV